MTYVIGPWGRVLSRSICLSWAIWQLVVPVVLNVVIELIFMMRGMCPSWSLVLQLRNHWTNSMIVRALYHTSRGVLIALTTVFALEQILVCAVASYTLSRIDETFKVDICMLFTGRWIALSFWCAWERIAQHVH